MNKPRKLAVVAIGGNSLVRPGHEETLEEQFYNLYQMGEALLNFLRGGYDLVITHGNGPQVGKLVQMVEKTEDVFPFVTMDVCNAFSQGWLGYMIQQSLGNLLHREHIDLSICTVVTQVLVDPLDPAFDNPTKPIGRFYKAEEADVLRREKGWTIKEDAGRGHRRVVPSPRPLAILEIETIRTLVQAGHIVIAAGGGGIPVIRRHTGQLAGVEGVIDKDRASALLAHRLDADLLVISTGVDKVYLNYGRPQQQAVDVMNSAQARHYLQEGHFSPGSMGPKIEAAVEFLEGNPDREVVITSPATIPDALQRRSGTRIIASGAAMMG